MEKVTQNIFFEVHMCLSMLVFGTSKTDSELNDWKLSVSYANRRIRIIKRHWCGEYKHFVYK